MMQQIANEMNLSETAFIQPGSGIIPIRYFTPVTEVPLCGHATLSTAHILYESGMIPAGQTITFSAKGGMLRAGREGGKIWMDFPSYPLEQMDIPKEFAGAVGLLPLETWRSSHDWILALATDAQSVRKLDPDFAAMVRYGLGHVMVTAPSDDPEADFVVRCFAPSVGIPEDPVTGSAHCALTPYWTGRTGKTELRSFQVSRRQGRLSVRMKGHDRVEIHGKAVTVFKIEMMVP